MSIEVVIRRFENPPQAYLVRERLVVEGIESFLVDEHYVGIDWLLSNALGGVRLVVGREDAVSAAEMLEDFDQGGVDYEPAEDQPPLGAPWRECPHCGADALAPFSKQRHLAAILLMPWPLLIAGLTVFLLSLAFIWKARWVCLDCQRRSEAPAEMVEEAET